MKSWRKRAAVVLLLGMCGIVGCFGKKEKVLRADSKDLKHTIITPHLEAKIVPGKNLIYCSTFQLAWNELRDNIIKEDIRLTEEPLIVKYLNKKLTTKTDISEECYLAMAGLARDGIFQNVKEALRSKFGDDAPTLEDVPKPVAFMAYAFLLKKLEFDTPFESLEKPVRFRSRSRTRKVRAFGIREFDERSARHQKLANQMALLDYDFDKHEFVVSLTSKSPNDEIVLAKIKPRKTLLATIQAAGDRVATRKDREANMEPWERDLSLMSGDTLQIPKLDFDIRHSYTELIDTHILNQPLRSVPIQVARQDIRFRLNERGAMLRSEAMIAEGWLKRLIFDGPFLLYLKEKQGKYPYLAIWVAHPEILMKK